LRALLRDKSTEQSCLRANSIAVDIRYYRKTGLLPINHQAAGYFDK